MRPMRPELNHLLQKRDQVLGKLLRDAQVKSEHEWAEFLQEMGVTTREARLLMKLAGDPPPRSVAAGPDELCNKARGLQTLLRQRENVNAPNVKGPHLLSMDYMVYYLINPDSDFEIHVDTVISSMGWEIRVFASPRNNRDKREQLRQLMQNLGIACKPELGGKGGNDFILERRFDDETDLDCIAPFVEKIVRQLANVRLKRISG